MDLETQVKTLTEELEKSREKLIQWKEKAKVGVDELRARVVSLTEDLSASEKKQAHLASLLEAAAAAAPSSTGTGTATVGVPAEVAEKEVRHVLALATLYTTTLECVSTSAWDSFSKNSSNEEFETYKRRTTMTLRLQTKNCESLQEQVGELNDKLQTLRNDLNSKELAIRTRDEALVTLSARMEAAESAKQLLEKQQATFLQGPNMEQVNRMDEQRERDIQRVRDEFMERESTLLAQHSDEMNRLVNRYEEEMQLVRNEGDERAAQALEQLRLLQLQHTKTNKTNEDTSQRNNAAYEELLNEQHKMEKEKRALLDKVSRLEKELQTVKSKERSSTYAPASSDDTKSAENPQSLEEAKQIIFQKRQSLVSMTEELWSVKKELMTLKQGTSSVLPADAMDGQQVAYLKSILLKLFAKYGDVGVFMHTLPVISMLLHIEPDELSPLYKQHPSFFQK